MPSLSLSFLYRLIEHFASLDDMDLTPRQVTTSFVGLAKLRFKWTHLNPELQQGMVLTLQAVAR